MSEPTTSAAGPDDAWEGSVSAGDFDRHVAVTETAPGRWAGDLPEGWVVGGGVNGGFQLSVVGAALRAATPGKPDPVVASAHYVSAARPGPVEVRLDTRREGGRTSVVAAELWQGDALRTTVLATMTDLETLPDEVATTATPPDLPPREDCVAAQDGPPEALAMAPFLQRFRTLYPREQVGWALGRPRGVGEFAAWFRLADGREPDPLLLLTVLDVLPPVTFDLGRIGWAPTLALTTHVRARPAPGWLRVTHRTRNLAGGMFEEDCEVWDSTDRLVGQARQLALLPR